MKIQKEVLLSILKSVRPGLAKKEIIDRSTHFILAGDCVMTYNDQVCVSIPLKTDFICSVPADDFFKVVTSMSGDNLDITFKEGKIFLKGEKSRASYISVSGENIGEIQKLINALVLNSLKKKWKPLPEDFVRGVGLCRFSASQDMTYGTLSCVNIDDDKIISSDNHRISRYSMKKGIKTKFLLRTDSASELVNFPVIEFYLSESWVYFHTKDGVIFSSRIMNGEFPDVDSFMKVKGTKFTFPKETKKLVEDVAILSPGDFEIDKRISIKIGGKKMTLRGEKDKGFIEKEIETKYTGAPIEFTVNPIFFSQVLEKSTSMTLAEGQALFLSDSFEHLMSLPSA